MQFGIVDKYTIEHLKPIGENPLLIRIIDKEEKSPKYYHNFISLYLDDMPYELPGYKNITDKDFKLINDFILDNDFDEIIVHCTMGISRSPAIMAFIAKVLNRPDMIDTINNDKHFIPNKLIIEKSREYTVQIKLCEEELIFRNPEIYQNTNEVNLEYDEKTKSYSIKFN